MRKLNYKIRSLLIALFTMATNFVVANEITHSSTPMSDIYLNDIYSAEYQLSVDNPDDYHVYMWLLPVKLEDSSFAVFDIAVNGKVIGTITPIKGNWQLISIDGNPKIRLNKGINKFNIYSRSKFIPQIEQIQLSTTYLEAIEGNSYDKYIDKINASNHIDGSVQAPESDNYLKLMTALDTFVSDEMELNYSFFTIQYYTKGETITLMTSSDTEHIIDFQIHSNPCNTIVNFNNTESPKSYSNSILNPNPPLIDTQYAKTNFLSTPVNARESQGLGWFCPSEKALNSNKYTASTQIKIPQTGYYITHLRTKKNGQSGTADLTINGSYLYENVPISLSMCNCIIPADTNEYTVVVTASTYDCDPVLFIHGADAERLVGFNDDCFQKDKQNWRLSPLDACITQAYDVVATKVSVCNYRSITPSSTCKVEIFSGKRPRSPMLRNNAPSNPTMSKVIPNYADNTSIISISNNNISIESAKIMKFILISTAEGSLIGNYECNDNHINITSNFTDKKGVYIITIVSEDGKLESHKIIL